MITGVPPLITYRLALVRDRESPTGCLVESAYSPRDVSRIERDPNFICWIHTDWQTF